MDNYWESFACEIQSEEFYEEDMTKIWREVLEEDFED